MERLIFAALLLLTGCATGPTPLNPDLASKIEATRVYAVVAQDAVVADVDPSYTATAVAGGGAIAGLIDGIVGVYRRKAADKMMAPTQQELKDFDFRQRLFDGFAIMLPTLSPLKVSKIETTSKPLKPFEIEKMRKEVPENGFLYITTTYKLAADLRSLAVFTDSTLWLRGDQRVAYKGAYRYTSPLSASKDRKANLASWTDGDASRLRGDLEESVIETMKMIEADIFRSTGTAIPPPEEPGDLADSELWNAMPYHLTVLEKEGRRYLLRSRGKLYSVSEERRYAPEVER